MQSPAHGVEGRSDGMESNPPLLALGLGESWFLLPRLPANGL